MERPSWAFLPYNDDYVFIGLRVRKKVANPKVNMGTYGKPIVANPIFKIKTKSKPLCNNPKYKKIKMRAKPIIAIFQAKKGGAETKYYPPQKRMKGSSLTK